MADLAVSKVDTDVEKLRTLMQQMEQIHGVYMEKLTQLKQRQHRILTSALEQIDRKKAEQILLSIKKGEIDQANPQ
jgi:hypothetical protein